MALGHGPWGLGTAARAVALALGHGGDSGHWRWLLLVVGPSAGSSSPYIVVVPS